MIKIDLNYRPKFVQRFLLMCENLKYFEAILKVLTFSVFNFFRLLLKKKKNQNFKSVYLFFFFFFQDINCQICKKNNK